jgi:hypothetical protein
MTTQQDQTQLTPEERALKVEKLAQGILRIVALEERFAGNMHFKASEKQAQSSRDRLEAYSDELIHKMHAAMSDISHPATNAFVLAGKGKSEGYISTYLHFKEEANNYATAGLLYTVEEAISSLSQYPQLKYENTPEYYRKAVALTGVIAAIQHHDQINDERFITCTPDPAEAHKVLAHLTNSNLADLILENPAQWEHIAELVTERQTDDADFIRSVLFHEASAVREGTL